MNDIYSLLPHSRKDAKLDTKTKLYQLNELADLYNCNNVLFFEARKGKDLYVWISKPPNGPTVKMHLQNCECRRNFHFIAATDTLGFLTVHTMEELHFTGNCLKGSRPILSFDSTFDSQPHLAVIKELLLHVFGVPKGARKSKPFVDHVMGFTVADGRIWIRCYQIDETEQGKLNAVAAGLETTTNGTSQITSKSKDTNLSLVEIGPRFVMTPIVIQESSFGGPIIYENKEFVSPNQVRADMRRSRAGKYNSRSTQGTDRKMKRSELGLNSHGARRKRDDLNDKELFAQ